MTFIISEIVLSFRSTIWDASHSLYFFMGNLKTVVEGGVYYSINHIECKPTFNLISLQLFDRGTERRKEAKLTQELGIFFPFLFSCIPTCALVSSRLLEMQYLKAEVISLPQAILIFDSCSCANPLNTECSVLHTKRSVFQPEIAGTRDLPGAEHSLIPSWARSSLLSS